MSCSDGKCPRLKGASVQLHGKRHNRKPTKAERAAHDAFMARAFPDTWGKRSDLQPSDAERAWGRKQEMQRHANWTGPDLGDDYGPDPRDGDW